MQVVGSIRWTVEVGQELRKGDEVGGMCVSIVCLLPAFGVGMGWHGVDWHGNGMAQHGMEGHGNIESCSMACH